MSIYIEKRNGFYYYNNSRQLGGKIGEKEYTSARMATIKGYYEALIKRKEFQRAREFEKKYKLPKTWLDYVISTIIQEDSDSFKKILIEEFQDRGYSQNSKI